MVAEIVAGVPEDKTYTVTSVPLISLSWLLLYKIVVVSNSSNNIFKISYSKTSPKPKINLSTSKSIWQTQGAFIQVASDLPKHVLISSRRKGFGEQAKEKVTPDSQKTYAQKASETATGVVDNVAATIQPSMALEDLLEFSN